MSTPVYTYMGIYSHSHTHIYIYIYTIYIYISIYYILYICIFSPPKSRGLGPSNSNKQPGCSTVGFACRGLSGAFPNRKGWEFQPIHPFFRESAVAVFRELHSHLFVDGGTPKKCVICDLHFFWQCFFPEAQLKSQSWRFKTCSS